VSDEVPGRAAASTPDVEPGEAEGVPVHSEQDARRQRGIDAAGRVIDAARVALERGDDGGAEDLLNAIRPPDGTIEASMAVLRAKIRDVRVARRQLDDGVPVVVAPGPPEDTGAREWVAENTMTTADVDEALVAWQFAEAPAPPPSAASPAATTPAPAGTATRRPAASVRFDASRPTPQLFGAADEPPPSSSPWLRWGGLLLVAAAATGAAYWFFVLR
jgi:hypothetical protein